MLYASGCLARYAYSCCSNRQLFTLHGRYTEKWKKQAKTLKGRKDTLALVYFYWGRSPPSPPRDRRHCKYIYDLVVWALQFSVLKKKENFCHHCVWSSTELFHCICMLMFISESNVLLLVRRSAICRKIFFEGSLEWDAEGWELGGD